MHHMASGWDVVGALIASARRAEETFLRLPEHASKRLCFADQTARCREPPSTSCSPQLVSRRLLNSATSAVESRTPGRVLTKPGMFAAFSFVRLRVRPRRSPGGGR